MVPFLIYWGALFVGFAWIVLSLFFTIFYTVRKENGNLWMFAIFNILCLIVLAIVVSFYRGFDGFGITQYSSTYFGAIGVLAVLTVLDVILGRTPKPVKA
ncbi:MAG: hypothetical protein LBM95_06840 [Lactobacillales bacterium]|nr:hypothetical protein [Lactobacillales bacterium]